MNTIYVKTRTIKDYIISASLLTFGIVAMFLGSESLAIAGIACLIVGALLLLVMKSGWKNLQDGSVYNERIVYFAAGRKEEVLKSLDKDPSTIEVDKNEQSNSLRLIVKYCNKSAVAQCQLLEYIPYKYEPCSKVYSYEINQIANLLK